MQRALTLAASAGQAGEVPVGAVIVKHGEVIAEANNLTRSHNDPTAHAEILAIRQAAERLQSPRLPQTTLYVTLEPCAMCVGAMIHARIERLVYAAREPRSGAVVSCFELLMRDEHNHRIAVTEGVLASEAATLLQRFFQERRR